MERVQDTLYISADHHSALRPWRGSRQLPQFMASLSDHNSTCKLLVSVATATKLGDEFACQLEDEHSTGLVVDHNHVTILVHRDALWPHQSSRAKFGLMDRQTDMLQPGFKWQTTVNFCTVLY